MTAEFLPLNLLNIKNKYIKAALSRNLTVKLTKRPRRRVSGIGKERLALCLALFVKS